MITAEKILTEPIRQLNWKQPYAHLMLPPFNKIETRTWQTPYRGLVLLCASKQPWLPFEAERISGKDQYARMQHLNTNLPTGVAYAVGRLVDCRLMRKNDENACFVKHKDELWCHVYADVTPIEPFQIMGAQRWGKVTDEIKNKIQII